MNMIKQIIAGVGIVHAIISHVAAADVREPVALRHEVLNNKSYRMKDIVEYVQTKKRSSTLVVFDIDNTLIMGTNPYMSPASIHRHGAKLQELKNTYGNSVGEAGSYYSIKSPQQPIEDGTNGTAASVKKLQNLGYSVIACTAAVSGKCGDIQDTGKAREKQLADYNISFSKSYSSIHTKCDLEKGESFCSGIYLLGHERKGEFIARLLTQNPSITQVVLIDDKINILNKAKEHFEGIKNTGFMGIEYQEANKMYTESQYQDGELFKQNLETEIVQYKKHGK